MGRLKTMLKNFFLFLLFMFLLTISVRLTHAEELTAHYNITLYTMTTDQQLTVAWDDGNPNLQEDYEFYLWNYGEQQKYAIGKTSQFQITVTIPRTGLYAFFCRACADVVVDEVTGATEYTCSDYSSSDMIAEDGTPLGKVKDPSTGEYTPGKWMVYGHVAPPTGGGVE